MEDRFDPKTHEILIEALKKAVLHGSPIRLFRTSKADGLFPEEVGKAGGVEDYCLSGESPFFIEEENRKGVKGKRVILAPRGLDYLASHLPADEISKLLDSGMEEVADRIKSFTRQWGGLISQNQATIHYLDKLHIRAVRNQEENLRQREAQIADQPIRAVSSADFSGIRRAAIHVVNLWKQNQDTSAKTQIEVTLLNMGCERISKTGEETSFTAQLHSSSSSLFPGDKIIVDMPGWLIHDGQSRYVLLKAQVRPLQ